MKKSEKTRLRAGRLMWGDEVSAQSVGRVVQEDDGTYELLLNPGVRLGHRDLLWIKLDPV